MSERIGQTAVVIGGSGALGSAVVRRLAEEGADVAFTYRSSADKAARLVADVEAMGRRAVSAAVAIEDGATVAAFVDAVVQQFGRIDTLVYASGPPFDLQFVAQIAPDDWTRVFAADVNGCFNALNACLPQLRQNKGSFVAITAAGVNRALARDVLSLAPKSAITTMVRHIAIEEGRYGVRANCVAPGYIDGGIGQAILENVGQDVADRIVRAIPLKRMGTADEIADAVSYVSSARASYITGTTIFVSGGMEL